MVGSCCGLYLMSPAWREFFTCMAGRLAVSCLCFLLLLLTSVPRTMANDFYDSDA